MSLYEEISVTIREVLNHSDETMDFKNRYLKLIENYFDNSFQDNDISELIDLVSLQQEGSNGY